MIMNCKKIHRRMAFINEILKERMRQLEKWGDREEKHYDALDDAAKENFKIELIQLAASCCQIYEAIDVQEK